MEYSFQNVFKTRSNKSKSLEKKIVGTFLELGRTKRRQRSAAESTEFFVEKRCSWRTKITRSSSTYATTCQKKICTRSSFVLLVKSWVYGFKITSLVLTGFFSVSTNSIINRVDTHFISVIRYAREANGLSAENNVDIKYWFFFFFLNRLCFYSHLTLITDQHEIFSS